jgi:hypothetical protein
MWRSRETRNDYNDGHDKQQQPLLCYTITPSLAAFEAK